LASRKKRARAHAPDAYNLPEHELRRKLATGEDREALQAYLGTQQYRELQRLALQAERQRQRGGPRVYVLPGIMGSKIGRERSGFLPDDVLWVDPLEICAGRLLDLALPRGNRFRAVGVMLLAYLKLKLTLEIAGFDASFHPFDWRQDIDVLGRELFDRVRRDRASKVMLVAHSMGGLVSRAAMALDKDRRISRLLMLGTPNFGSFAPVQALRGTYPAVRKIAMLDLRNEPEVLAKKVFTTFPGLHQMLPALERFDSVDLYDSRNWPNDGLVPDRTLLKDVARVRRTLAAADDRFTLIAGVNQETVVSLSKANGAFEYQASLDGDGTVPLEFARLPDCRTYYIEESHGSLPNNGTIGAAVVDLLRNDTTTRLPSEWQAARRARRTIAERELRAQLNEKRDWSRMSPEERRQFLEGIAVPVAHEAVAGGVPAAPAADADGLSTVRPASGGAGTTAIGTPGVPMRFDQLIVARRRQRSIEVRLARGSITEANARALVLGIFNSVDPGGAAAAIDERLNGAVKEFTARRMFSGDAGEMFAMPTGRHLLRADTVLFAGLGAFDRFTDDVQQFVAENVVRTFVRTQVEDFATVLWGTNSGVAAVRALANQLQGYFKGLVEADADHSLRRITLCEYDAARYEEVKAEVYRLSATGLFEEVQVTFDEVVLPETSVSAPVSRNQQVAVIPRSAYVIVNQEQTSGDRLTLRASLLTAGTKAAVISEAQFVSRKALDRHLREIESDTFTRARLRKFGATLAELTLHPSVAKALTRMQDNHVVVVHDAAASRIPWETLCIDGWFPAGACGLSRRFAAEGMSVAKWSDSRRLGKTLDVLLVVNPTGDLAGADAEGEKLQAVLGRDHAVRLTLLKQREATRQRLAQEFRSGAYDVLHYAGHAHFDAAVPARSGLLLSDGVLTGADLSRLGNLPALMFFNACESARVRGGSRSQRAASRRRQVQRRIDENVGLAEAFLRGGATNYLGTYWPVGDAAAASFATTLYSALVEGCAIGDALNRGRKVVEQSGSVDWADYVHYGSFDFVLKLK
jgi:pimeloyl-ACP methyl ester carboxylesterase